MKKYKDILKEINKNRETKKAKELEVERLEYKWERRRAAEHGRFNNEEWHKYYELAQANEDTIKELYHDIYILEIKARILKANARAALLAESLPIIKKAFEPYAGKPYGEKTAEKIREEVHRAGYGFYFEGQDDYRIVVYTLNEDGYKSFADESETKGTANDENGHIMSFITSDNKINVLNVYQVKPRDNYSENPTKDAHRIDKAIKAYNKATKEIESQRRDLCDLLPDGIPRPDTYIREYQVIF